MSNFVVGIPEQPFLLVLWIMVCYSLIFVFIIELLITILIAAEIRLRLHRIKVQKRKQVIELKHLERQQTPNRFNSVPPPVQRSTRRQTQHFF